MNQGFHIEKEKRQVAAFVSAILVLAINLLFSYKYLSRFTAFPLLFSGILLLVLAFIFLVRIPYVSAVFYKPYFYYLLVACYAALQLVMFRLIQPATLHVDRWSLIQAFWDAFLKGNYPYAVRSHLNGSVGTMPVYFLLAFPFYLLHEIGYFSLAGLVVLAIYLRKNHTAGDSLRLLAVVLCSLPVFWEIAVRSTILVNSVLFLLYTAWIWDTGISKTKNFWIAALLGGLLLSTRTVFSLGLVIYTMYMVRQREVKLTRIVTWGLLVMAVFCLTLLPFVLLFPGEVLHHNPFRIQSEQLLSPLLSVMMIAIAMLAGLFVRDKSSLLFLNGLVYLIAFIVFVVHISGEDSLMHDYLGNRIDVSYSMLAFPFLIAGSALHPARRS